MRWGWFLLAVAGLAIAASSPEPFFVRAQRFRAEQTRKAAELGLSRQELKRNYPTPELRLTREVQAMPGETVEIRAQGRIPKGSLVGLSCPDVEVLRTEITTSGVVAKVKIPRAPQQQACFLEAIAPISGKGALVRALEIGANYDWRLRLGNGARLRVWTEGAGDLAQLHTEWTDPASTRQLALPQAYPGEIRVKVQRTPEDEVALQAAWAKRPESADETALWAELARMRRTCAPACEGQMRALLNEKLPAIERAKHEHFRSHPQACDELLLRISDRGTVTGKAFGCARGGEVEVSGEVKMERRR